MFYGRKKELSELENFYNDANAKVACIYGRRGIGKTTLVKEFLSNKRYILYTAYSTTAIHQTEMMNRVFNCGNVKLPKITDTEGRLRKILNSVEMADDETLIIVIDQYHNFAKSDSVFDKILSSYITGEWADKPVKLILCSDSYLQVNKLFFDKKSLWKDISPLFVELNSMGYYESKEFFDDSVSPADSAFLFGITGGIPGNLVMTSGDVKESIYDIFFSDNNDKLPEAIMQSELRELSYYNHILLTLAEGNNRVNKISECVNKPKDIVVPYMNTLMSIGMVTKENPVTEKTNRKKTRYSIVNPFDDFWYKLIAPNMDMFYSGEVDKIYDEVIVPEMNRFMEKVFISMCREYLERAAGEGKFPFEISEIGNWWHNDDDKKTSEGFDLVGLGSTQNQEAMIFAQCYFTDQPVGIANLKELIDLTKQIKGKKNVFYMVFSKCGFHENTTTVASTIKNIILVSLEDIYSA